MQAITVIGAGTMGNGIAHVFAQNGYRVTLCDISEASIQKALTTIAANLDRMVKKGTIGEDIKASTLNNIATTTSIGEACAQADLVVEAATENIELKLNIFRQMDAAAPAHCIRPPILHPYPLPKLRL